MAVGTSLRCPGCGKFYANLDELQAAGGYIYQLGLALKAKCGACGKSWAIGGAWRKHENKQPLNKIFF